MAICNSLLYDEEASKIYTKPKPDKIVITKFVSKLPVDRSNIPAHLEQTELDCYGLENKKPGLNCVEF